MAGRAFSGRNFDVLTDGMNPLLTPLAEVYGLGAALREQAFRRGWLRTRRLSRPVISVGNLTVGGTGKTPLVARVAETLLQAGYKPAILSRGYRRKRGADLLALEPQPERRVDPREVGDEPALLAGVLPQVPIVISADRYRAGQVAEKRFGVDVHILDDGFQHLALERDLDLVAIDVTQELEDCAVLPAGRLRERVAGLRRADLIVLTRTELRDSGAVESRVRALNPRAQLFRGSTALQGLREIGSGRLQPAAGYGPQPVCAFCGIGNPGAFFGDLRRWGFRLGAEIAFRDHHVYTSHDIARLQAAAQDGGAAAFLTTEKDVMNLPSSWKPGLPLLACVIRAEVSPVAAFEQALLGAVSSAGLSDRAATAH